MMLTIPHNRANLCPNEFGSSHGNGTSPALCRMVQRFFYAQNSMMVGVIGSLTARTFHYPCLPTSYNRRRHSLEAVSDGLITADNGHKAMPRKKATGEATPNNVQISLEANRTLLITQIQNADDVVIIHKSDVLALRGHLARLNFILSKTEFLWDFAK